MQPKTTTLTFFISSNVCKDFKCYRKPAENLLLLALQKSNLENPCILQLKEVWERDCAVIFWGMVNKFQPNPAA